jgi:hypothetical protein
MSGWRPQITYNGALVFVRSPIVLSSLPWRLMRAARRVASATSSRWLNVTNVTDPSGKHNIGFMEARLLDAAAPSGSWPIRRRTVQWREASTV